jgi:hypothetical protein
MKIYIQNIMPVWIDAKSIGDIDREVYALNGFEVSYVTINGWHKTEGVIRVFDDRLLNTKTELEEFILFKINEMVK